MSWADWFRFLFTIGDSRMSDPDILHDPADAVTIVAPLPVDDDITPRVIAGGPQIDDDTRVVTAADLDALRLEQAAVELQRAAFLDGLTFAGFWLRRQHDRAALVAADHGLTADELAAHTSALRALR